MKTIMNTEEVLRNGNSSKNQEIKGKFVGREIYCNVNSLVEYCLNKSHEDSDSPVQFDELENYYTYPEWSVKLLGETLSFDGGTEEDKETFLEEFDRLEEESQELLDKEEISEATHERNLELIAEAKDEFNELEQEPQEVFEWWAVSGYLYDKLKELGHVVVDTGSCKVWGRTTTGQAILLDYVITRICADLGILEGQENEWECI
jgi:hypothetical protein